MAKKRFGIYSITIIVLLLSFGCAALAISENMSSYSSGTRSVSSFLLEEDTIHMGVGNQFDMLSGGLITCGEGTSVSDLTFSSGKATVASVSPEGIIRGKSTGKTKITIKTKNGYSGTLTVTVDKYPKSAELTDFISELSPGMTTSAHVSFPKKTYSLTAWSSSAPDVACIDPRTGIITAVSEGRAVITCSCPGGSCSNSFVIDVTASPTALRFEDTFCSVPAGSSIPFSAQAFADGNTVPADITYSVSNPSVVRVDDNGMLTGINPGTAEILAVTQNGVTADEPMTVCVSPLPDEIELEQTNIVIGIGDTSVISCTFLPSGSAGTCTFSSSKNSVASVTSNGTVSGMSIGNAVVTVKVRNTDISQIVHVRVVPYSSVHGVESIAHRGASGNYPPGNTLKAFSKSADLGATGIELDVQMTADGVIIIRHDSTIKKGGVSVRIADITYSELQKLDPNICTYAEVLEIVRENGLTVMTELKASGIEAEVLAVARESGAYDQIQYGNFDLTSLERIKELDPTRTTVYLISSDRILSRIAQDPLSYSFDIADIQYDLVTPKLIRSLHLGGKKVYVWTPNTASLVNTYVDMGADGITTDYPQLIQR